MNSISIWTKELAQITESFQKAFGQLGSRQLNWKPNPKKWSIGQCIDHIITTNETYFKIFDALVNENYPHLFYERMPLLPGLFGKMLLKAVAPDRKMKSKTFPVFEPDASAVSKNIVQEFGKHQQELLELIKRMDALNHKNIIITSPANKHVIYSLYTALEVIIAHEKRHFQQALEVFEMQRR